METARSRKQRKAVKCLMGQLLGSNDHGSQVKLITTIAERPIFGIDVDAAKRRVAYHWKGHEQKPDSRTASALLSAVIDLPARWIEDVWNGRR